MKYTMLKIIQQKGRLRNYTYEFMAEVKFKLGTSW